MGFTSGFRTSILSDIEYVGMYHLGGSRQQVQVAEQILTRLDVKPVKPYNAVQTFLSVGGMLPRRWIHANF